MIVPTVKILKLTMNNPLSRCIIRYGLTPCEDSETNRLEHALDIYLGQSHPASVSCEVYSAIFKVLLEVGARVFGVNETMLKNYFNEPVTKRGLLSVLRGIGKYGITKPQFLDAPFLVVWNFTNACNLRCRHCYQNAGKPALDELTEEEKIQVVEEMGKAGVVSIAFSGGEPLLKKEFYKVASKVNSIGMHVALATNGTLLTKKVTRKLKASGVNYVEISLDSASPERHDEFRGIAGSFEKTLKGIKNCVNEGIFTCIATTVTQVNLYDVLKIIELAEELGCNRFIAFNFIPAGRGKGVMEIDLSPKQREKLLEQLVNQINSKKTKIEILSTAPQFARVCLELSRGKIIAPTHFYIGGANWDLKLLAEFIGGCGAGRLYCALQPNGDVTPCVFMPDVVVGNVREKSFLDIWKNSEVMQKLRNRSLLKGPCGQCKYKFVCGGCRARAYGYFNDMLGSDPGCLDNETYWIELKRKNLPLMVCV